MCAPCLNSHLQSRLQTRGGCCKCSGGVKTAFGFYSITSHSLLFPTFFPTNSLAKLMSQRQPVQLTHPALLCPPSTASLPSCSPSPPTPLFVQTKGQVGEDLTLPGAQGICLSSAGRLQPLLLGADLGEPGTILPAAARQLYQRG